MGETVQTSIVTEVEVGGTEVGMGGTDQISIVTELGVGGIDQTSIVTRGRSLSRWGLSRSEAQTLFRTALVCFAVHILLFDSCLYHKI